MEACKVSYPNDDFSISAIMVFVACDNVLARDPAEPENEDQSQTAAIPASPARSLSDPDREQQPFVPVAETP